jgi:hypothetical protein
MKMLGRLMRDQNLKKKMKNNEGPKSKR